MIFPGNIKHIKFHIFLYHIDFNVFYFFFILIKKWLNHGLCAMICLSFMRKRPILVKNNSNIEIINWEQARKSVKAAEPELADIIDNWHVRHPFIRVRYNYGDKVLKGGILHLTDKDGISYPIHSAAIPEEIQKQLSYSNMPLGIITAGSNEVFSETGERVIPLAFFKPGVIMGLWESLEENASYFPKQIWDVSAGARSIFMLPSISQRVPHEQLKKHYGVKRSAPNTIYDHHSVFRQIIQNQHFKQEWVHEILFLGEDWLIPNNQDIGWLRFYNFLSKKAWKLSGHSRNKITFDRIWLLFSQELETKGIKANSQLIIILKQIFAIAMGAAPGFRPIVKTDIAAPAAALQKIYLNTYGLKNYIPTIMALDYFSPYQNNEPIYYSLQVQTQIEPIYKFKNTLSETRAIKTLLEYFVEFALEGRLKVADTLMEWIVKDVQFDFYHPDTERHDDIHNSKYLPSRDKALIEVRGAKRGRKFSHASPLAKGCVQIRMK